MHYYSTCILNYVKYVFILLQRFDEVSQSTFWVRKEARINS